MVAHGTGRRLGAIVALRFDDLRLQATPEAPHGAIRWRAETDKQRREQVVPISPAVRAVLDGIMQERPGIGSALLFPSGEGATRPISKDRALIWLRQAEQLAKLEHVPWGGFHALRRGWASSRKHLPAPDVAAAGGWGSTEALVECYQQADAATVLSVVLSPAELREVRAG